MTIPQILVTLTIIAACVVPPALAIYALIHVLNHMDVEIDEDTL